MRERERERERERLTILEDPLHIEAIRSTGLIVGASLEVVGQLPGSHVINDAGVALTDGV